MGFNHLGALISPKVFYDGTWSSVAIKKTHKALFVAFDALLRKDLGGFLCFRSWSYLSQTFSMGLEKQALTLKYVFLKKQCSMHGFSEVS